MGPLEIPGGRKLGFTKDNGAGADLKVGQYRGSAGRSAAERFIHAGSGVGARQRTGATGACGHRFDAHCRNASRNRIDSERALRDERARLRREIRRWQKQCDGEDPNEGAGVQVSREALSELERQLGEIPVRLQRLQKSGMQKISRSDPDSRFLRERGGFVLGYTGTLAVSGDHLIVAQRVSQETNDNEALLPMIDQSLKFGHYRCLDF